MTGIFDGMAGALNEMFGAPVTHTPDGGASVSLHAVFREGPLRLGGEDDGEILTILPTLRVTRPAADGVATRDLIAPGNGKTYRVLGHIPSGSPAADANRIFELELIT